MARRAAPCKCVRQARCRQCGSKSVSVALVGRYVSSAPAGAGTPCWTHGRMYLRPLHCLLDCKGHAGCWHMRQCQPAKLTVASSLQCKGTVGLAQQLTLAGEQPYAEQAVCNGSEGMIMFVSSTQQPSTKTRRVTKTQPRTKHTDPEPTHGNMHTRKTHQRTQAAAMRCGASGRH